ncbi:MAG: hypothetical protein IJU23_01415 [Proteobacteria bacterium]|nr:hypothetical protein [Pseudomonadota bacterium]
MVESIKAGFCFDNAIFDDAPQAKLSMEPAAPLDLRLVSVRADGRLRSGTHALILKDRAARLEVQKGTECKFEVVCCDDARKLLSLKKLSISFTKPVRLANFLTTMSEFSALIAEPAKSSDSDLLDKIKKNELLAKAGDFIEKRAADLKNAEGVKKAESLWRKKSMPYLDRIANSKGWKKIVEAAEKTGEKAAEISPVVIEKSKQLLNRAIEYSEEKIDSAVEGLDLTAIEISSEVSEMSDKKQRIRLKLKGEAYISDKIRLPFDFEMPGIFMSRMDAELTSLLSQFCVSDAQGMSLSKTFIGMVEDVRGQYEASFDISKIVASVLARGGRTGRLHVETEQQCGSQGSFSTDRRDGRLNVQFNVDVTEHGERTLSMKAEMRTTEDALIACGEKLNAHEWSLSMIGKGEDIEGRIEISEGSRIHPEVVRVVSHDPRLRFDICLPLQLTPVALSGTIDFGVRGADSTIFMHGCKLLASGNVAWIESIPLDIVKSRTVFSPCEGGFRLKLERGDDGCISAEIFSDLEVSLENSVKIDPIPELKTGDEIRSSLRGHVDMEIYGRIETKNVSSLSLDCSRSNCLCRIEHIDVSSGNYSVFSDSPAQFGFAFDKFEITSDGISESLLKLTWNMEKAPIFKAFTRQTELVLTDLLSGHLTVRTSPQGLIHFEDGDGFFDEHFFNMLLYPEYEKAKICETAKYGPILSLIGNVIRTLEDVTGPGPGKLLDRIQYWYGRCQELGIVINLNQAVNMRNLARMLSLFCFDSFDDAPEFERILMRMVQSKGVDRYGVEKILDRAFPNVDFTRAVPVIKIVDRIFSGLEYEAPKETHEESNYDEYSHKFRLLPSANQLFDLDTVPSDQFKKLYKYGGPCLIDNAATRRRIYKYAAGYTVAQLEWLLAHHADLFSEKERIRLERLVAIKKRIQKQQPWQGSFIVQDFNIDYFIQSILDAEYELLPHISDLSDCLDDFTERCESNEVVECFAGWLVPQDVGRLLSAGIASRIQGQLVQLNQARLLDYLVRRGQLFAAASFNEACNGGDRVLMNLLQGFLSQDQDLMETPVDRTAVMSKLFGIEFPVRSEYMSGGPHASESYYGRLYEIAHQINGSVEEYLAAKLRMQSDRVACEAPINEETPKRPPYECKLPDEDEIAEISRALDKADALGAPMVSAVMNALASNQTDVVPNDVSKIEKAYRYAWRLASAVLEKYPDVLELDVFKRFYGRTYEALMIQTLDQNLLDDTYEVRHWFAIRSGIEIDKIVQLPGFVRRNAIIDVLYWREDDRETRRRDPLTWIDIRPGEGTVDLTVIAAMGVITEGSRGKELRHAFDRLEKTRNIHFVRANTGNIKPLEYNSQQIEQTIRECKTPFMLLGYSQGCANMMSAESRMFGGTPDDWHCLDRLVARHFMFSALNGSVHAICGGDLYRRTVIDGEQFIKMFSGTASSELTDLIFKLVQKFLDEPWVTMSLSSVDALSHIGLRRLSLDAQYMPGVISTEVQGVLDRFFPDALYYVKHAFDVEAHTQNDSQVGIDCAHAWHVYNRNDSVDILRREAMPTCTLRAHHWNPLYEEVVWLETEKDKHFAVYHAPEDIHIVPAIEALILFGRLKLRNA